MKDDGHQLVVCGCTQLDLCGAVSTQANTHTGRVRTHREIDQLADQRHQAACQGHLCKWQVRRVVLQQSQMLAYLGLRIVKIRLGARDPGTTHTHTTAVAQVPWHRMSAMFHTRTIVLLSPRDHHPSSCPRPLLRRWNCSLPAEQSRRKGDCAHNRETDATPLG